MSEEMQACSMDVLNDDCLELILSQFGTIADIARFERVSKRWAEIISHMWKKISVLDFTKSSRVKWGFHLKTLEKRLKIESLRRILQNCGDELKGFDTSNSRVLSHTFLEYIGEYCPNLEFAKVRGCGVTVLDDEKSIVACKRLERFSIVHLNDENVLFKIFSGLENLKSVEIQGDVTSCFIGSSLLRLPETVEEIRFCKVMIDTCLFQRAVKSLPNLKSIDIDSCSALSSEILETITKIESLRTLKLAGVYFFYNNNIFSNIASDLRNLEVLEVLLLEKHSLKAFIKLGVPLMDGGFADCSLLTDDTLKTIAMNCPKLRCLDITGSFTGTDEGIEALLPLEELRALRISFNLQVTDKILSKFTQLNHLSCIGCCNVKDRGIIEMMRKSPKLESLDLCMTTTTVATIASAIDIVAEREKVPLKLDIGFTPAATDVTLARYNARKPPLLEIINSTFF